MKPPRWNPYLVGALIGLLSVLTFSLANKPLGMSTGLAQAAGACAVPFLGAEGVAQNTYWAKSAIPAWDYSTLFLVGTMLGAFLSAMLGGAFRFTVDSSVWSARFGTAKPKRLVAAFVGGFLALFGARLADGCTSGHGISGCLQLAVSGWFFFIVMFASGILTARLLYGRTTQA
ncbi:MAG: hypothetical protein RLZZ550_79 [Verrucomicrobiota bacterium]|jgi:uncharacterized membrane protein YedE/YeeE